MVAISRYQGPAGAPGSSLANPFYANPFGLGATGYAGVPGATGAGVPYTSPYPSSAAMVGRNGFGGTGSMLGQQPTQAVLNAGLQNQNPNNLPRNLSSVQGGMGSASPYASVGTMAGGSSGSAPNLHTSPPSSLSAPSPVSSPSPNPSSPAASPSLPNFGYGAGNWFGAPDPAAKGYMQMMGVGQNPSAAQQQNQQQQQNSWNQSGAWMNGGPGTQSPYASVNNPLGGSGMLNQQGKGYLPAGGLGGANTGWSPGWTDASASGTQQGGAQPTQSAMGPLVGADQSSMTSMPGNYSGLWGGNMYQDGTQIGGLRNINGQLLATPGAAARAVQ